MVPAMEESHAARGVIGIRPCGAHGLPSPRWPASAAMRRPQEPPTLLCDRVEDATLDAPADARDEDIAAETAPAEDARPDLPLPDAPAPEDAAPDAASDATADAIEAPAAQDSPDVRNALDALDAFDVFDVVDVPYVPDVPTSPCPRRPRRPRCPRCPRRPHVPYVPTFPMSPPSMLRVEALSLGADFTCARLRHCTVRCWGANAFGQLGDGTHPTSRAPCCRSATSPARGRLPPRLRAPLRRDRALLGSACWAARRRRDDAALDPRARLRGAHERVRARRGRRPHLRDRGRRDVAAGASTTPASSVTGRASTAPLRCSSPASPTSRRWPSATATPARSCATRGSAAGAPTRRARSATEPPPSARGPPSLPRARLVQVTAGFDHTCVRQARIRRPPARRAPTPPGSSAWARRDRA